MPLHTDTLVLVQIGVSLTVAWLLVAAAWSREALEAQRLWAGGNVLVCVGVLLGAAKSWPLWVHGVLGYGICGLGLGAILHGLMSFCGRPFRREWTLFIGAIALLVPLYFSYAEPSLTGRRVASGLLFGTLNLYCAYVLLRYLRGEARQVLLTNVAGFAALGGVLLLRAWYWSHPNPLPETLGVVASDKFQQDFFLLAMTLAQIVIAFGQITMVAYRHSAALTRLTLTDRLTNVYNRSALDRLARRMVMRAAQEQRPVAVAMVDADHFKAINDTYGHTVGDEVIKHLAQSLSSALRATDLVVRYGGEEFLLLLDGFSVATAAKVAERIRSTIEASSLTIDGRRIAYTVSIGIAGAAGCEYDLQRLIEQADANLYEAKHAGRNRVWAP